MLAVRCFAALRNPMETTRDSPQQPVIVEGRFPAEVVDIAPRQNQFLVVHQHATLGATYVQNIFIFIHHIVVAIIHTYTK